MTSNYYKQAWVNLLQLIDGLLEVTQLSGKHKEDVKLFCGSPSSNCWRQQILLDDIENCVDLLPKKRLIRLRELVIPLEFVPRGVP